MRTPKGWLDAVKNLELHFAHNIWMSHCPYATNFHMQGIGVTFGKTVDNEIIESALIEAIKRSYNAVTKALLEGGDNSLSVEKIKQLLQLASGKEDVIELLIQVLSQKQEKNQIETLMVPALRFEQDLNNKRKLNEHEDKNQKNNSFKKNKKK